MHPLVASWRPSGPLLLIERSDAPGATLLAVPLDGGAAIPLVALPSPVQLGYDLRDDGSVLAVALAINANTARIAIWDLASGTTRWLTEEEPGVMQSTPVWSADGSLLYYAAHASAGEAGLVDLGIFRVRGDGTQKTRVRGPDQNGAQLRGLTPYGRGLVWDRIRAGGAVEVLDLASGTNHSFDETTAAALVSWRRAQPRALVIVGGCCAGRPGGSLALWNDTTGSSTMVLGIQSTPPIAVTSAAWEPGGGRFAAAVVDRASANSFGSIFIYDAEGRQLAAVAATDGAQQVMWLPMGMVFTPTDSMGAGSTAASPADTGTTGTTAGTTVATAGGGVAGWDGATIRMITDGMAIQITAITTAITTTASLTPAKPGTIAPIRQAITRT